MNKNKIKTKEICDNIYGIKWYIIIGGTIHNALKKFAHKYNIKEKKYPQNRNPFGYCLLEEKSVTGLIWLCDNNVNIGILVHECFHATLFVFNIIGIENINIHNDEAFAYYLGWIVDEINRIKNA